MSNEYASVDDLLADEVTTTVEDVTLPNGKKVSIRGMSRYELQQAGKGTEDSTVVESRMLADCIVTPKLTYAQVLQMQKAKGPTFLREAIDTMRRLSGLDEGADKSDVAGDGDR